LSRGNNTLKVVEELKTKDLSAFAAILSVSPYYNKPTQESIILKQLLKHRQSL
jgi:4-hydroxy-tetrahydrodipicolinate synthase